MKNFRKQKKEQKVRKNAQFFDFSKIFLLYEAEKKISKKSSFFEKEVKTNDKAAEKALNNKEVLGVRTPMHPIRFTGNNSKEFDLSRVTCLSNRIFDEKQEADHSLFRHHYSTNDIFFVNQ